MIALMFSSAQFRLGAFESIVAKSSPRAGWLSETAPISIGSVR
jgi:hypothetical protein